MKIGHFNKISKKGHCKWYQSMVLEPIEVMEYRYEFKKWIKSYCDDTTKHIMQVFKLMASQLRGKLAAGGSRSFHHGGTHNTIHFE